MTQNREGKRVPNVTFRVRQNNEWKSVTTDDLFAERTSKDVVLQQDCGWTAAAAIVCPRESGFSITCWSCSRVMAALTWSSQPRVISTWTSTTR